MKEVAAFNILCAIISAKWALELGVSQARQVIFALGGLMLGPLMLLVLYVRLIYQAKAEGNPAAKMF